MRIACVNYQAVSLYRDQGWSVERLGNYYNPANVADKVLVAAYEETDPFDMPQNVHVEGYNSQQDLEKLIFDFNPDVVRCYEANYPFCMMALNAAQKLNVPSYLSLHDSRKSHVKQLSGYTVITAYTETVQKMVKARVGKDIELQLNGIDSKFFDSSLVSPDEVKLLHFNLEIGSYDFLIYTIGRNDPLLNTENQCKAIEVFKASTGVDVKFIISGPGFENGQLDHFDFVRPIGKTTQSDIRAIHTFADCFMQVRIVPEISMAVTEAMMMGVPIIHAAGNETEKKIQWPIGLIIDNPNDPSMMADHIEFMWRNIEEAKAVSEKRRMSTIAEYDEDMWREKEAQRYRELYNKSLEWKKFAIRAPHGN